MKYSLDDTHGALWSPLCDAAGLGLVNDGPTAAWFTVITPDGVRFRYLVDGGAARQIAVAWVPDLQLIVGISVERLPELALQFDAGAQCAPGSAAAAAIDKNGSSSTAADRPGSDSGSAPRAADGSGAANGSGPANGSGAAAAPAGPATASPAPPPGPTSPPRPPGGGAAGGGLASGLGPDVAAVGNLLALAVAALLAAGVIVGAYVLRRRGGVVVRELGPVGTRGLAALMVFVIGTLLGAGYVWSRPVEHVATATVAVVPRAEPAAASEANSDLLTLFGWTYVPYLSAPATLRPLAVQLRVPVADLAASVSVEIPAGTTNVVIHVAAGTPAQAADRANAIAKLAVDRGRQNALASTDLISPAAASVTVEQPNRWLWSGAAAGLALAVAVVVGALLPTASGSTSGRPRSREPAT